MDCLERAILKERACASSSATLQPSMKEMQAWVTDIQRRRSLSIPTDTAGTHQMGSFQELEQRYHLHDVWGHTTTPAMQTLECIQKVKEALLAEDDADDSISRRTFLLLAALGLGASLAVILFWELYLRPRDGAPLR